MVEPARLRRGCKIFKTTITSPAMRRYWLYIISFLAFSLLVGLSLLLWREWSKRFPAIEAGHYVGMINGIFVSSREQKEIDTPFYVERSVNSDRLTIVLMRNGWGAEQVAAVPSTSDSNNVNNYMPIIVSAKDARLKLTGFQTGASEYSGSVEDLQSGARGTWSLRQVNLASAQITSETREYLKLWLLLKTELSEIDAKIEAAQLQVPKQRDEISRLTASITDADKLRSKSEEKLAKFREALKDQQKEILAKREQLSKLEQSFEISQRVSGMGKLVSLARETLERDGRWFESMLRVSAPNAPEGLQEAVSRAERISELKRQIAAEREKIENPRKIDSGPARPPVETAESPGETPEPEPSKSSWGGWSLW